MRMTIKNKFVTTRRTYIRRAVGVFVFQVTASDWDAGDNGRIQYSIPGTVGQMFHVDQQGVISIHAVVDREKYDSFRFPILAVDRGTAPNMPLTGSALVVINVEDVDDERPRFLQPHYVFGVYENEPEGKLQGCHFDNVWLGNVWPSCSLHDSRREIRIGMTTAVHFFAILLQIGFVQCFYMTVFDEHLRKMRK